MQNTQVTGTRLDCYLMPLLVAGFFVLQLDRSNTSNAMTDTLTEDLKITQNDVNVGSQVMSAGIIIAEIPSNFILQHLGVPVWLTFQMGVWGTIAPDPGMVHQHSLLPGHEIPPWNLGRRLHPGRSVHACSNLYPRGVRATDRNFLLWKLLSHGHRIADGGRDTQHGWNHGAIWLAVAVYPRGSDHTGRVSCLRHIPPTNSQPYSSLCTVVSTFSPLANATILRARIIPGLSWRSLLCMLAPCL